MQRRTLTPVMPRGARIQPLHIIAANEIESNKATLEAVRAFYEKASADPSTRPEYLAYCERRVAFHQRQIDEYQAMLDRINAARLRNVTVRELSLLEEPIYGPSGVEALPVAGSLYQPDSEQGRRAA